MEKLTGPGNATSGMLYDANYDMELEELRNHAKIKLFEYNAIHPSKEEEKANILRNLFHKTGKKFKIEGTIHFDYGFNIELGENFYANINLVILDQAKVTFGNDVFIGPNVGIYTAGHPVDIERRNLGLEYALPVKIGNNVWIGGGVQIVPGVTIGDGAVIGTGSVVTKDIPSNFIAVGNPCKVLREVSESDKLAFTKPRYQ